MNSTGSMNQPVLALMLTLFSGFAATASTIEYQSSIGAGTANRSGGFIGSVSGPIPGSANFSIALSTSYPCCFSDLTAPGSYSIIDSASSGGNDFAGGGGSFDLNGTHYACSITFPSELSNCSVEMDFRFPINLPDFGSNPPFQFTQMNPFTAEVNLGFSDPSCGGACFHLDVFGYGNAVATLQRVGPASYHLSNIDYVFTPEPATLILSGFGLFAVVLLSRLSRQIEGG